MRADGAAEALARALPRYVSPGRIAVIAGALLLSLTAWAALTEVETVVTVPAEARPCGGSAQVRAPVAGRVAAVWVAEGEAVTAGRKLLRLDDAGAHSRWRSARVALEARRRALAEVKAVAEALATGEAQEGADGQVRLRVAQQRARLDRLDAEVAALVRERALLTARAAAGRGLLDIRRERLRGADAGHRRGAVSRFELLRLQQDYLAERAALEALERQAEVLGERETAARSARWEAELSQRQSLEASRRALAVEVAELEAAVAEAAGRDRRQHVRSPVDGVVDRLDVAAGAVVDRGELLAVVVPTERPLVFEARVAPRQAAFLRPGQPCRLKLDALPFARYGVLPCTLERLALDVVSGEAGAAHYRLRVRPAADRLTADGVPVRLQPGATARVDVVAGRRTVLGYLTEPLRRFARESLRER
jgi:adhesin transport system membrane fusion protein